MCESQEYNDKDQRELDYFGFRQTQLCEDFGVLVETTFKTFLLELQNLLTNKFPSKQDEIQSQIEILTQLYMSTSRNKLEAFKENVEAIFQLSPNILLPGYIEKNQLITREQVEKAKKEYEEIEAEYIKESHYKMILESEAEKLNQLEPVSNQVNSMIEFLMNTAPKSGEKRLKDLCNELRLRIVSFENIAERNNATLTTVDMEDLFSTY